jgi:hypothetical protein
MTYNTRRLSAFIFALFIGFLPVLATAQDSAEPAGTPPEVATRQELGYGFGSVVASVLYSPLKVTYAGLGLLTGGLGYVLSAGRTDVANNIIFPAVKGNYVITPSHLKGEEPVVFIGAPPPDPDQQAALSTPPAQH